MRPSPRGQSRGIDRMKAVRMPMIDPEAQSYILVCWQVGLGDTVQMDQDLAELDDGQERFQLPSPLDGIIVEICITPDEPVSPGDIMALIEEI